MKRYRVLLTGFVLVSVFLVVFLLLRNAKNYKEDSSLPVMAKKAEQISMRDSRKMQKTSLYATKGGLYTPIRSKSQILYYGYDGGKKRQTLKIYGEKIQISAFFTSTNYLYVSGMDSGDEVEVLWQIPLSNGEVSTKKCRRLVEGDDWSRMEGILATEEYFIMNDGMLISRHDSDTGRVSHFFPDEEVDGDENYEWISVRNGADGILQKGNYFFLKGKDAEGNVIFYKVNTDNLQREKLDNHVIGIYQDFNDEIFYFMSDEKGNYVYNPETGKKYGVGGNYQKEFKEGEAAGTFDFYMNDYNGDYYNSEEGRDDFRGDYSCYNRDVAEWLHEKNPWDYQNREGGFTMENLFVYQGRMYVNVKVIWKDAKEVEKDENGYLGTEGNLLFSYDLKDYSGIREETQINKIMSQYSKRIRNSKDEGGKYNIYETGEFPYQLQNVLILRSLKTPESEEKENSEQYSYVFYDLDTGKYKPIDKKSKEFHYLYYAGVNEYESDLIQ